MLQLRGEIQRLSADGALLRSQLQQHALRADSMAQGLEQVTRGPLGIPSLDVSQFRSKCAVADTENAELREAVARERRRAEEMQGQNVEMQKRMHELEQAIGTKGRVESERVRVEEMKLRLESERVKLDDEVGEYFTKTSKSCSSTSSCVRLTFIYAAQAHVGGEEAHCNRAGEGSATRSHCC